MKLAGRVDELTLSFVSGIQIEAAERGWDDTIPMAGGEPRFDPPESVRVALSRAVDRGGNLYSPFGGYLPLRERIADKLARFNGISLAPSEIYCTPGGATSLYVALTVVADVGDEVLVQDPCWEHFPSICRLVGIRPIRFPMYADVDGHLSPDVDGLRAAITPRTRAILLNTPLNPSGDILRDDEIDALLEVAEQYDLLIVCDEEYEAYTYGGRRHTSPGARSDRVLTLHSFSKSFALTGIRLGYISGAKKLIAGVHKVALYSYMFAPSPSQLVAQAVLEGDHETFTRQATALYESRMRLLRGAIDIIPGITCPEPEGGLYVMPSFSDLGMTGWEACRFLFEEAHVTSVPGEAAGSMTSGAVRLFHGLDEAVLRDAASRIGSAVDQGKVGLYTARPSAGAAP